MKTRDKIKEINDRYGEWVNVHRKAMQGLDECREAELRAVRAECKHVDDGGMCKKCGEMLE